MKIDLTDVGNFNFNRQCIKDGKIRIAVVYNVPYDWDDWDYKRIFTIDNFGGTIDHRRAQTHLKRLRDENDDTVIIQSHDVSLISNDILRPDCYFVYNEGDCVPFHRATMKELRYEHNIEKMFRAGAFNNGRIR